jgi:hypothetical protein
MLDLEVLRLDTRPSTISTQEAYFLAASTAEPETVFHSMIREINVGAAPAMVLTGYHGDKVWDRSTTGRYLGADPRRGDTSGLNLSEARLCSGFVHVAVPFIHARSIHELVKLANSPEMKAWRLDTDYDRPIPRRILESVGVPRGAFGTRKRTVIDWYSYPVNRELRSRFFRFMYDEYGIPAFGIYLYDRLNRLAYYPIAVADRLLRLLGFRQTQKKRATRWPRLNLPNHLFVWAVSDRSDDLAERLRAGTTTPVSE